MKTSFSRQPRTSPVGLPAGGLALRGQRHPSAGYALLMVMCIIAVSLIVLAATMQRTGTVARLNHRNNTYVANVNAAEAATEKVFARLAYDFVVFGYGAVVANLPLYRTNVPNVAESDYWNGFEFSDGQGNEGRTYVNLLTTYSGPLPSQYPGLFTLNALVYRIVSNAKNVGGLATLTNAAQVDVLLGFVPISTFAVFYNSLLEFSTAAPMTVNGRVHANGKIYTGSSSPTVFNGTVTAAGTLTSPRNNDQGGGVAPAPGLSTARRTSRRTSRHSCFRST